MRCLMRMREYMNPNVITVTSGASISKAEKVMLERNIRRLPVADTG